MTFAALARSVRAELGQRHRYAHSLGVARFAERLAAAHGLPTEPARVAGVVHDIARLYPPQRLLAESQQRGIPAGDFERANPIVLHAPLGAEIARERYGIDDPAILSAIRKHTLADDEMSPLDETLFLADALEPGRDFPERERLAGLAFADRRAAMRGTLASTLAYLRERSLAAAPQTLAAARAYGVPVTEAAIV